MKKSNYILIAGLLFITFFTTCSRQRFEVKKVETIDLPDSIRFIAPRFTPDGENLLLTSAGYRGLWLFDLNEQKLSRLNNYFGAGYQPQFLENGEKILFRYDRYPNRLRHSYMAVQNLADKKVTNIISNKRDLSPPLICEENKFVYLLKDRLYIYNLNNNKSSSLQSYSQSINQPFTYTLDDNLILFDNGHKQLLNPAGHGHYIWSSASPDGNKILFTVAGQATYISDIEGNILSTIKQASTPKWSPNSKWILFTLEKDDGHRITSSDIYMISSRGEKKHNLTATPDKIELNPSWSPDGNKIIYETGEKIEIIHLK